MVFGWQEFAISGISLVMCLVSFLPIVIIFLILKRRFQSRSANRPQTPHHTEATSTPPEPSGQETDDQWGQTKYGFDETDWGSEWGDDRDSEPRIQR